MDVRTGTSVDVPALVDVMFSDPPQEAVALAGTCERAQRFQAELLTRAFSDDGAEVLVATGHGEPVGFAWVGEGSDIPPLREVARMAVRAMGVGGSLAAGWRSWSRLAVDVRPPPGGRHLVELHVHARHRGRGVGGRLLGDVAARIARAGGGRLTLTTGSSNPARRLYDRHGFVVVDERRSRRYERLTGIPGRVLMAKEIPFDRPDAEPRTAPT